MGQNERYSKHVDLIRKEEFTELFSGQFSIDDWFTAKELETFSFPRNAGSLAARFLVKRRICSELQEAQTGKEIEILNDPKGKPILIFGEKLKFVMQGAGVTNILCSLSHSRHYITAMTIICY